MRIRYSPSLMDGRWKFGSYAYIVDLISNFVSIRYRYVFERGASVGMWDASRSMLCTMILCVSKWLLLLQNDSSAYWKIACNSAAATVVAEVRIMKDLMSNYIWYWSFCPSNRWHMIPPLKSKIELWKILLRLIAVRVKIEYIVHFLVALLLFSLTDSN